MMKRASSFRSGATFLTVAVLLVMAATRGFAASEPRSFSVAGAQMEIQRPQVLPTAAAGETYFTWNGERLFLGLADSNAAGNALAKLLCFKISPPAAPRAGTSFSPDAPAGVYKASWIVNSAADDGTAVPGNCPGPGCRLRDALAAAAVGDTITFGGDFTITLVSQIDLNQDVTIDGAGHAIVLSGNNANRIFSTAAEITVVLNDLTLQDGYVSGDHGGGIYNQAELTLNRCNLLYNIAVKAGGAFGGAIYHEVGPTLNLQDCNFFSNGEATNTIGGALLSYGTVNAINCTFLDNYAVYAGAVYNLGTMSLMNCTLAYNQPDAVDNALIMMMSDVTITENPAAIWTEGQIMMWNTIVSNSGACVYYNTGLIMDNGGNINWNCPDCVGAALDPKLGPVDYYGGYTPTAPLMYDSAVLDTAPMSFSLPVDQRGAPRPAGDGYDPGAYESTGYTVLLSAPPNPSNSASPSFVFSYVERTQPPIQNKAHTYTYRYRLDGGPWTACPNPQLFSGLSDGNHTLTAVAVDETGIALAPVIYPWFIDATAPTVSLSSGAPDPTNTAPIPVTVTFSENVNGFTSGDVVPGNATVVNFAGSGASYSFDLQPLADGLVTADIAAGAATDDYGNGNTAAAQLGRHFDNTPPTVTINQAPGQADPTNIMPIHFTVVFNETVTGFVAGDVDLSLSTAPGTLISTVTGGPSTYDVSVAGMTGNGLVIARVPAGAATDGINLSQASTSVDNQVAFDLTPPTVTINQAVGQADPSNASPILFTVVFSEPVAGFATGDVDLSASTAPGSLVGVVSGGPTTYTVSVSGMTGNGLVIASVPAGAATDGANLNLASTSADNQVAFDMIKPSVVINQMSGQPDPTNVNPVLFLVVFSEPVTGFAAGDVALGGPFGGLSQTVTELGPFNGTTYEVTVSGLSGAGTLTATIAASAAFDLAGNSNFASTSSDNAVAFDNVPLTVALASVVGSPTNTTPIPVTVTFSKSVVGFDSGDITPTNGLVGNFAGSGASYSFNLTPLANGLVGAAIAAGAAVDAAGNGNTAAPPFSRVFDSAGPDTTLTVYPTNPSNDSSPTFAFTGSDPGGGVAGFEFRLDGSTWDFIGSPLNFIYVADGLHTFEVRAYDTAGNRDASPATCTWRVDTIAPDTTITSQPANPSNSDTATFTFTGSDPGGSGVDHFEGRLDGGGWSTMASPRTYTGLPAGSHTFEVRAVDAAGNTDGSPASYTWQVRFDSATSLVSAPNPSAFGQMVTFTAAVTSTYGVPTGSVTFMDGATPLGTVPLSSGTASLTTAALAVGTHPVVANYGGDPSFNGSASPACTQTVDKADTTTTLTSAPNASRFGQGVTFTATVSVAPFPTKAPSPGPTGTVTFLEGSTVLGTGALIGSTATFSTSTLAAGSHGVTARYDGDGSYNLSTSSPHTHTVDKADTTTTVNAAPNPSRSGEGVTFTATVAVTAPGAGTPTGTVTFLEGAATLGTGTLSGLTATFSTSALAVGPHDVTARYEGDGSFNASTSPAVTQTVQKADTVTAATAAPNPSRYGEGVTVTATVTVTAPGSGTPTGTVTFLDGATTLGTGPLSGGVATYTTTDLAVGAHSLTARYEGDGSFNVSTSTATTQTVQKADTATVAISSVNPSVWGQPVTFTATVNVASSPVKRAFDAPTGTVTFLDGAVTLGTGTLSGTTATFVTADLTVGTHPITARYEGDGQYNLSTSPAVDQVVNLAATSTALATSRTPQCFGQEVVFTATVTVSAPGAGTPTGTVSFLDGAAVLGTGALSPAGLATFATTALATGTHAMTARYEGDGNFAGSTSAGLSQVMNLDASIEGLTYPTAVCAGERATLTMTAGGTGPFVYRWFESADGVSFMPIPGAAAASYTTPPLSARRIFKAALEGACGQAEQIVPVEVTVPLTITQQPLDTTTRSWQSATLTVVCDGLATAVQWYEGAAGDTSRPVDKATSAVFPTPPLDRDAAYWARLSNPCGTVDTDAAAVTILNTYYLPHAANTDLWWTRLDLVNASAAAWPFTLDAYRADGALLEHLEQPTLAAQAQLSLDAATLFSPSTLAQDCWVQVTSKANLKGLLTFGTQDHTSRTGLPFLAVAARQLVFPYVALTDEAAGAYYTGLTLVNVGGDVARVTLTAFDEAGAKLAEIATEVPPQGKYVRLLSQIFPSLADPKPIRSVTAAADQPLVGFELFGTLLDQGLAGLPAIPTDEAHNSGFYYGLCYSEIPPNTDWYTGLTFANLEAKPALVSGEVYDAAGKLLGLEQWELQPMQQLTREIWGLLDPARYASAAHLIVGSYQRIAGFELVLSRPAPFRFDGLAGIPQAADRLVFPVAQVTGGATMRLRLINKSDKPMNAVATAYDASGTPLGTYPLAFMGRQTLDLDLAATFPAALANLAWVGVTGDNILYGDAFVRTDAGQTLMAYPGLPER